MRARFFLKYLATRVDMLMYDRKPGCFPAEAADVLIKNICRMAEQAGRVVHRQVVRQSIFSLATDHRDRIK